MSYSCADWRGDIGAYIVGALDGRARARVGRHLVACHGCRADYDELVPVRGWLSQLAAADGAPDPDRADHRARAARPSAPPAWSDAPPAWRDAPPAWTDAPPAPHLRPAGGAGQAGSDRAAAQLPRRLRAIPAQGWRWLLAAGAGLAAGAAIAGVLLVAGPSARTYQAVSAATGVSGHAELHNTPTGTEIDLTASGLPAGERCILVAVARGGADIAGTWDATYSGSARIAGTSAFPASQLTALRIESDTGVVLLSIHM